MGVKYQLLAKDKLVLADRKEEACFSEFPHTFGYQKFKFDDIAYINFQVKNNVGKENGIKYLQLLKGIGFAIEQEPQEILKDGYLLCLKDFRRGKHIYASEIGAHLTAIRYLSEFTDIVTSFLNIVNINPDIDKWLALQMAHFFGVNYNDGGFYGWGHCLFGGDWHEGNPYKPWEEVQKGIPKSNVWEYQFRYWDINKTYGQPYAIKAKDWAELSKIKILDEQSLEKAITCIKSLSAPKTTT